MFSYFSRLDWQSAEKGKDGAPGGVSYLIASGKNPTRAAYQVCCGEGWRGAHTACRLTKTAHTRSTHTGAHTASRLTKTNSQKEMVVSLTRRVVRSFSELLRNVPYLDPRAKRGTQNVGGRLLFSTKPEDCPLRVNPNRSEYTKTCTAVGSTEWMRTHVQHGCGAPKLIQP